MLACFETDFVRTCHGATYGVKQQTALLEISNGFIVLSHHYFEDKLPLSQKNMKTVKHFAEAYALSLSLSLSLSLTPPSRLSLSVLEFLIKSSILLFFFSLSQLVRCPQSANVLVYLLTVNYHTTTKAAL